MVKKNDKPSSDNDLIFGRYNKQIDYRAGVASFRI